MGDSGAQGLHLPVSQPTMDRDVTFTEKEADISGFLHHIAVTLSPQWERKESFLVISDPQRSLGT